jgi:hypothetical protein
LAGLRPPPAPAPTLREGVNVLLARAEEVQKVHAHVFAGLANAEKDEVFPNRFRGPTPLNNIPQCRKSFDGMLRVVVIPRNAIVLKKREELVSVLLEALFAFYRCLALEIRISYLPIEAVD